MSQNKKGLVKSSEKSGNWLKNSFFVHFLIFVGALQDKISESFLISKLLGAKTAVASRFDLEKRVFRPFRLAFSREMEQSALVHMIDRFFTTLLATPIRSYGTFLMSFAVYYLAIALVKGYFQGEELFTVSIVVRGLVVLLLPLPLLLAQKDTTLAKGLLQSRFGSFFLFDLLGLEKEPFEKDRVATSGFLAGFLGGIVVAVFSAFVPLGSLVWFVFAVLFARLCYVSPESGVLFSCVLMPFLRGGKITTMLLCVAFFFFIKLLRGKRNLKAGFYTYGMCAYLLLLLFGGLVTASQGGFKETAKLLSVSLSFFLPALLLYRKEWIARITRALVLAGVCSVLFAALVYGSAFVPEKYLQVLPFVESLQIRFQAYASFGAFAVALLPVITVRAFNRGQGKGTLFLLLSLLLLAVTVVLSRDPGIWICYLLVIAMLLVFRNRNVLFALIPISIGAVAVYLFLLPSWISDAVASFSRGFEVDFSLVYAQLSESLEHFLAGTGIGSCVGGGNFYTHMLIEQGIAGVALLLFLIFGVLSYGVYAYYKNDQVSPYPKKQMGAFAIGLVGMLCVGFFADFWQDEKMLFMLFFYAGAVLACGKVLCDESVAELRVSEIDKDYFYQPVFVAPKKEKKSLKSSKEQKKEQKKELLEEVLSEGQDASLDDPKTENLKQQGNDGSSACADLKEHEGGNSK